MLYSKNFNFFSEIHIKHINTLWAEYGIFKRKDYWYYTNG